MSKFRRMQFSEPCSFCGRVARYHFETGAQSYCCESNVAKCPAIRKKNSEDAKQRSGRKHSEETKEKIRRGNLGRIVSEETKAKLRRPKSEEHKAKLRKPKSEEHKRKLSLSLKGKFFPNSNSFKKGQVAWNKGKPRSEEVRRKISQTRTERLANGTIVISEETKGKMANSRKGQKRSDETRRKMSLAASGENSSQWQGGIAAEPYCDVWLDKDFKESIRERDDHMCQNPDCWGRHNHRPLHIHHINYDKKNCGPSNLITVCISCNMRANKNREEHIKFYQEIMSEKYGYAYDISNTI